MRCTKALGLVHERILRREVVSGMRDFVEDYLERNDILRQQLNAFFDIGSTDGIISAVDAGRGIGFVPCIALEKALRIGTVRAIRLGNSPIWR